MPKPFTLTLYAGRLSHISVIAIASTKSITMLSACNPHVWLAVTPEQGSPPRWLGKA